MTPLNSGFFFCAIIIGKTEQDRIMAKKLFNSEYQPAKRGQDKRTLILEALKQSGRLSLPEDASKDEIERAWFAKIAAVALDDEHKDSGMCKQALLDRGWAKAKPEASPTPFDFNKDDTPSQNATTILASASDGDISIEDAGKLLTALKDTLQITESTELIQRLEAMEQALKAK